MAWAVAAATAVLAAVASVAAAGTLSASYRKDAWLEDYIETEGPEPLTGGRVHIVGLASAGGKPDAVYLNGTYLNMSSAVLPEEWLVDWVRVEPLPRLHNGEPFWLSFHSRDASFDAARASGALTSILVTDAAGKTLVNGTFSVAVPRVPVTWVTTAANRSALLVYLHNNGGGERSGGSAMPAAAGGGAAAANVTLVRALVNGVDVTAAVPAAGRVVPLGQSVMWQLSPSLLGGASSVAPGSVWTLVATWSDGTSTAAGGVLFSEFFPVETWPHSSDCPFPGMNDTAYALHRSHGIDTFFSEWYQDGSCNSTLTAADIANTLAPQYGFYILPSAESGKLLAALNDTSHVAGIFLADEDDTKVDHKARDLLAATLQSREAFPGLPTYAGGASNRYTGAYAGITDVKGMDAYIGACAPHYALLAMPARGSYDYLANTRANHAPGPTWLYSQGFESGWDSKISGNRQADAAEIAIQVLSVPAAGAKGVMLFETQLSYSVGESAPAFATMGTLLRETGALRELYRAGDATGMVLPLAGGGNASAGSILAEGILSPRAMVVLLINTQAVGDTYNDICCGLDLSACHFTFVPVTLGGAQVVLPAGVTVVDSFEIFNASLLPGAVPITPAPAVNGSTTIALSPLSLGIEGPGSPSCGVPSAAIVRTFVLAFDSQLRTDVEAALAGGPPAPPLLLSSESSGAAAEVTSPAAAAATVNISWWRSARDTGERLAPQPTLSFGNGATCSMPGPGANSTLVVSVNTSATYQTIWGFGGAVTESAVHVFGQLAPEDQENVLSWLYGEAADGSSLRYTSGRLTIGSCDFALGYYNYAETPFDYNMSSFSIAHDEQAIIPFLLRAQAAAVAAGRTDGMEYIAAPWSPPAWMKSNYPLNNYTITAMSCFPLGPLDCALLPEYQPSYALYLSRYLSAYAAAGVQRIRYLSVQNEPQPQTGTITYEGMWLPPTAALQFVAEYLGPQLQADGHGGNVSIAVFDHNQNEALLYATPILADPKAASYVGLVAYHWYSGPDWSALEALHDLFPGTPQLATEATAARGTKPGWFKTPDWGTGEYYGRFILRDLLSWSTGFLDWNILLDHNGGPDHGDPTGELCEGLIPCGSDAMVIADTTVSPPVLYKQAFYWYMAAVSRFVPRGSVRVGIDLAVGGGVSPIGEDQLLGAAFLTPAGQTVAVLMNAGNSTVALCLNDDRYGAVVNQAVLEAHSIQTLVW